MKALVTVFILAVATTTFASETSDCTRIYDDGNGKTPTGETVESTATSTVVDD